VAPVVQDGQKGVQRLGSGVRVAGPKGTVSKGHDDTEEQQKQWKQQEQEQEQEQQQRGQWSVFGAANTNDET